MINQYTSPSSRLSSSFPLFFGWEVDDRLRKRTAFETAVKMCGTDYTALFSELSKLPPKVLKDHLKVKIIEDENTGSLPAG